MITARHPATQHKRPAFLPNYIQSIFSVTYRPGRVDDEVDGVVNSLHKVRFLKSSNCPFDSYHLPTLHSTSALVFFFSAGLLITSTGVGACSAVALISFS